MSAGTSAEAEAAFKKLAISSSNWYPRPKDKCSGKYYEEKVRLLVNWFKFESQIYDTSYYEYKVTIKKSKDIGKGKVIEKEAPKCEWKTLFWALIRHFKENHPELNIVNIVYDDHETVYSTLLLNRKFVVSMRDRVNTKIIYTLELDLLGDKFQLLFSSKDIADVDKLNRSNKLIKTVMTQKARYSPADRDIRAKQFTKNFFPDGSTIYRVPDSFKDPSRYNVELECGPRIEAWVGIYMGVRELFDGNPVINFGLMDKLFINAPEMSLFDYILLTIDNKCVDQKYRNEMAKRIRDTFSAMRDFQRRNIGYYLKDVKLKSAFVWVDKIGKLLERHLSFIQLSPKTANSHILSIRNRRGPPDRLPLRRLYELNNIPLIYPDLPLVECKSGSTTTFVPIELLYIHEKPQKFSQMLNGSIKLDFIRRATRPPHKHKELTMEILNKLELDEDELNFAKGFKLSTKLEMIDCPGKVLNEPKLVNKKNERIPMTKYIRGFQEKELNVVPQKELCVVIFVLKGENNQYACLEEDVVAPFYVELMNACIDRGLRVQEHEDLQQRSLLQLNMGVECFKGIHSFCPVANGAKKKFDDLKDKDEKVLLFLVFSERNYDVYGHVKQYCDNVLGVASQVINSDTAKKGFNQTSQKARDCNEYKRTVFFNIALKINAKLGGINQELDYSEICEVSEEEKEARKNKPLKMYVGIDVTHPTLGSGIDHSIASIVASINRGGTRYRNEIIAQTEKLLAPTERRSKERTDILMGKFLHLLQVFAECNDNHLPDHIVVYRDGLSDSEMLPTGSYELKTLFTEIQAFMEMRDIPKDKQPLLTYIVVQKRHRTRLYKVIDEKPLENAVAEKRRLKEMKESEDTGITNVTSGTMVDKVIVSNYKFDFWLVAHHGQLGTSRPIHYNVIYDDSKTTPDEIYKMTYDLCLLSARCRKPISIPAPVHYADLCCEKAKEYYKAYKAGRVMQYDPGRPITREQIENIMQPKETYQGMHFA